MNAAELFVLCLENEGVETIFGIPGQENVEVIDALLGSKIRFITSRHEQGAAFMADVYGRLTGQAGVCLSTFGPGTTNLLTGVVDAHMDRSPLVVLAGEASPTPALDGGDRHLDLLHLFRPISKLAARISSPQGIPEAVRKAFQLAEDEKPGVSFLDLPQSVAAAEVEAREPLEAQPPIPATPTEEKVRQAVELLAGARRPLILAGHGVVRAGAAERLEALATRLDIPVVTTPMAKGVIPSSHPLSQGAVGIQLGDDEAAGFGAADLILCAGYDPAEYPPILWNRGRERAILHLDASPAEVDEHYPVACSLPGHLRQSLKMLARAAGPCPHQPESPLRQLVAAELERHAEDTSFPLKPQRIVSDLRRVLGPRDVVVSDVGAHKLWLARLYPAESPNTVILSNSFAAMGLGLPGAISAKLALPERTAVAVAGDAGFLMSSQEMETALRIGAPVIALVWNDGQHGLFRWHRKSSLSRESHIPLHSPDLVRYAESFGARGYRVEAADELEPILRQAVADDTVVIIDCPVDHEAHGDLITKLGQPVCAL